MTPDETILKILKSWAPEVNTLLTQAGYFDLPRDSTKREEIARKIGFSKNSRLYRAVLEAAAAKNSEVVDIVLNEYSLRAFKSGSREVAKQLNIPFPEFDWNDGAQQHFKVHGLELVKKMSLTDLVSLKDRIQYDFNMSPSAFAKKYASSYSCSESRLTRIKRTETHTSAQAGGNNYAKLAECEFKQWLCTPKGRWPRARHRAMWYEIAKMGDQFSNGLYYPSEPNCRCYLIYFINKDHLKWGAKSA